MDYEYYANGHDGLGSRSPLYGHPRLGFMQPIQHNGLPTENCTQRMRQSLLLNADDQQLLALNMLSHLTWPTIFGVKRSTVSKILRQREKYLFPEDRSLSPVKRAKGKYPDIERALSN
ncbi:hypothetical protein V8E51_001321 [Hyaloscypha variabilis]